MKKSTKDRILNAALRLFNRYGTAEVSIRQIAEEVGISHSNLTYHLGSKEKIIDELHDRLLDSAVSLNSELHAETFSLESLYLCTKSGFEILYEYRFFVKELSTILKADRKLKEKFLSIEKQRTNMYLEVFNQALNLGIMSPESYPGEHLNLIKRIRIFSDSWITAAEIYDTGPKSVIISENAKLFMEFLFPYLTVLGKQQFMKLGMMQECSSK